MDWLVNGVTALAAVVAVIISIVALRRATPKPVLTTEINSLEQDGDKVFWHVKVVNKGSGVATDVKLHDGDGHFERDLPDLARNDVFEERPQLTPQQMIQWRDPFVPRNDTTPIPGFQLRWRQLPNEGKVRRKVLRTPGR